PGWMGRDLWPSQMLRDASLPWQDLFETPRQLLTPLADKLASHRLFLHDSIVENEMVGGYVPASKVPTLARRLRDNDAHLLAALTARGHDDQAIRLARHKICEALDDAALRRANRIPLATKPRRTPSDVARTCR